MLIRVFYLVAFMALVLAMILGTPVWAQSGSGAGVAPASDVKVFDFFVVKGGIIAFGLIALSIVTVALTIEHCLSIRRAAIVPTEAAEQTKTLIGEKKYLEAIKFTAEDPSMIGYVLNACLLEASNGFAAMERALEEALEERSARLFRKIEYVNIIGNVAPMIGLLGTVTGMILLFAEIHAADTFPGARIVADKIAIALITTFWGLAVAIPALSIYAIFRNRIDVLSAECALTAERILSVFKPGAESDESTSASLSPPAGRGG
ncbi:MAG: MotA/TolQ/ExbB proton channel family protein [Phycisphaerales bacterium]|nr:MAG: MotA/TolQ/ExbB proton channel family protein [Phycisphaerales bacterium]